MALMTISKLRYWCYKVLPLAYDDSLSYYEVVDKCVAKLNEIIENNNKLPEAVSEEIANQLKGGSDIYTTLFGGILSAIATNEGEATYTANVKNGGEVFWLNGKLVECVEPMTVGQNYVEGSNIVSVSIDSIIEKVKDYLTVSDEGWQYRATITHEVNSYFFWKDELCKATKDIAVNDILTSSGDSANCAIVNLGAEIRNHYLEMHEADNNLQTQIDGNDGDIEALQNKTDATNNTVAQHYTELNARISNIVAQSSTDNTEVVDARLESPQWGTKSFASLGDAIRTQLQYTVYKSGYNIYNVTPIAPYDNCDTFPNGSVVYIFVGQTIENVPFTGFGGLVVSLNRTLNYESSSQGGTNQIAISNLSDTYAHPVKMYMRWYNGSAWSKWHEQYTLPDWVFQSNTITSEFDDENLPDLNYVTTSDTRMRYTAYTLANKVKNSPFTSGSLQVYTLAPLDTGDAFTGYGALVQIVYNWTNNKYNGCAYRVNGQGKPSLWSPWQYIQNLGWKNLFTTDGASTDSVIDANTGELLSNQYTTGWHATDYLPTKYGDIIQVAFANAAKLNICGVYDKDKKFLGTVFMTSNGIDKVAVGTATQKDYTFIMPYTEAAYIRYNYSFASVPLNAQYIVILGNKATHNLTVDIDETNPDNFSTFNSLYDVTRYIENYKVKNCTVHVKPGTYDLVSELGDDYINAITTRANQAHGLHIGNNTHYIFDNGANVVWNYTGDNDNAKETVSAFNVYGSVILENANVEVTNGRYCVHEDAGTFHDLGLSYDTEYLVKYIGGKYTHNGNTDSEYKNTIPFGCGVQSNSTSIYDGVIVINNSTTYNGCISYHTANADNKGIVEIFNCFVNKRIQFVKYGTNNIEALVTGCHMPEDVYVPDTSVVTLRSWNNDISA